MGRNNGSSSAAKDKKDKKEGKRSPSPKESGRDLRRRESELDDREVEPKDDRKLAGQEEELSIMEMLKKMDRKLDSHAEDVVAIKGEVSVVKQRVGDIVKDQDKMRVVVESLKVDVKASETGAKQAVEAGKQLTNSVNDIIEKLQKFNLRLTDMDTAKEKEKRADIDMARLAFATFHEKEVDAVTQEDVEASPSGIRGWISAAEAKMSPVSMASGSGDGRSGGGVQGAGGGRGSFASAVRGGGSGTRVGVMQGGGLSHLEANCIVFGGFKFNTHANERVKVAKKILAELLPHSSKHFGNPVVQFLEFSVIRAPLKSNAPRSAIEQAVEEYALREDKPLLPRDDIEAGAARPCWVQAPMEPNRRRRNAILRRALAYCDKHHAGLGAEICFGTGALKVDRKKLMHVNHEGHVVYYAYLRDKQIDKDALQAFTTNVKNNVEQEAEY